MRGRILIGTIVAMALVGAYAAYRTTRFVVSFAGEFDRATELAHILPRAQSTIVMDRHQRPAFTFYAEQRINIPVERVSRHMLDAIVAVEDRRFYSHYGVDPVRIAGAALTNVRAGRIREGGSTITQQLIRATQLSAERTFERKIREAMIALRLEERYSKSQILQAYLNTVYFGQGYYGVEAASRGYFSKPASELTAAEAALLAAVVRTPSSDAPAISPERALRRRNLVLRLMRNQQRLTEQDFQNALRAPLGSAARDRTLVANSAAGAGDYFQEEVRRQLMAMFGSERVLRGGLRVFTTYDPVLQRAAEESIRSRLAEIARHRKQARDLQGSLVALDPTTGDVLALVGGRSFAESSFNRATQARRQAGSAFKPIVFAAALERGFAPGSLLRDLDMPIDAIEGVWLPDGEHEEEEYTLRRALKVSSNRAAVQLLQHVGVGTAVYYAHRLGIASELPEVPSLALGTGEVTLLELTAAYGVFANEGVLAAPRLVTRVEDADGTIIWSAPVQTQRAISRTNAFLMSSMLADVVSGGTAAGARTAGFKLPAGGKTGATDDYADAWFVGYTPHVVAGVWFGFDTPAPIMSRGFAGTVAVPAWARFMKTATAGARPDWYAVPSDVEKVAICRASGARAADGCKYAALSARAEIVPLDAAFGGAVPPIPPPKAEEPVYEDFFPLGVVSPDVCPLHGPAAGDDVTALQRPRASEITVQRVQRANGTVLIVMRGGG
jgi:penicillin-binding protein 1A